MSDKGKRKATNLKPVMYYEKFLTLWKDVDPGIAEVARERVAGLKQ